VTIGELLRQARERAGLSLTQVGKAGGYSRQHLSNVERGARPPNPQVIAAYEKALNMNRRQILRLATASVGSLVISQDEAAVARDVFATIAAGDDGPLTSIQTTHAVDHGIQRLAVRDNAAVYRLTNWLENGSQAVLRVNAAGILGKTGSPDIADSVALSLRHDQEVRDLYLKAVRSRVGISTEALSAELVNQTDSGARWCAAYLLAQQGKTKPLAAAMRTETSRENLRHMALALAGETL
jgi:transcriptional regulator with XRE-family HTH domain